MALLSTLRELAAGGFCALGGRAALQRVSCGYEYAEVNGRRQWREATTPKFVILAYHRVGTGGVPIYTWLETKAFDAQMRFLRDHYPVLSLGEMLHELREPSGIKQGVVITFDDGYRGVYTEAYPILRKFRLPAMVYLPTDIIDSGEAPWYDRMFLAFQLMAGDCYALPWDRSRVLPLCDRVSRLRTALAVLKQLRRMPDEDRQAFCSALEHDVRLPQRELADCMITWEQVMEMQAEGVEFGAHTLSHPIISRLGPAEVESQIFQSKEILQEKLGHAVLDFAYPFGQPADCGVDATVVLKRLGFRSAVTTCNGTNTPRSDTLALRRMVVGTTSCLSLFACSLAELFLTGADVNPLQFSMPAPLTGVSPEWRRNHA